MTVQGELTRVRKLVVMILVLLGCGLATFASDSRQAVIKIVQHIQRADYEGDRAALKDLYRELTPFVADEQLASRVQYWRGFALWRRAINGFNEHIAPGELESDLQQALDDFEDSARKDPDFQDAKIGSLSCLGLIAFSVRKSDPARARELVGRVRQERAEVEAAAAENPRLLWVVGPMLWNMPAEQGGGQAKAIELYEKALEKLRTNKPVSNSLEPSWGEPELLMNLAWSNLNREKPDLDAAEQNAEAALELVPHWHYVRDILMPQIREARKKQNERSSR